jgi:hypothetical protein
LDSDSGLRVNLRELFVRAVGLPRGGGVIHLLTLL